MDLKPLDLDSLCALSPFFAQHTFRLSDYTLGYRYMWAEYIRQSYAIEAGCLCIRANIAGQEYFTYPLSSQEDILAEQKALTAIEQYCVEQGIPLLLTSVPIERLDLVTHRYGRSVHLSNPRTWRDYLYRVEDFAEYAGKRFAGQRNHVSKFRRLYPEAAYAPLTVAELDEAQAFLDAYAERQYAKHSFIANEELHGTKKLLDAFDALGMIGGVLRHEGKMIALTFGEISGDTLVVHVEKALVGYDGVYPTIAHEFAKAVQAAYPEKVLYINREDDAGDCGLRKSKLQYNPIRIVDKYNLEPKRVIDDLVQQPVLTSPRLTLRALRDDEAHLFGKLARDIKRNRYWGWNWREAWTEEGDPRDVWFLELTRKDFAEHREISLGLFAEERFVGEGVFHNFTYDNAVELGVRLLPEAEHQGFAAEAMRAMADYALCYWGLERVTAKCYRDNLPSKAMLERAGLRLSHDDDTFHYFARTAKN